jgi:hypothetical protein
LTLSYHYRSDDCKCKLKVSVVTDFLKKIINMEREVKSSKPAACLGVTPKMTVKPKCKYTAGRRLGKLRHSAGVVLI